MKRRVLIIEDDRISFVVGKTLFEAIGFEVDHAVSGEEGMDLYAKAFVNHQPYDAVYMDLGLPQMTGIEVCVKIREFEKDAQGSPTLIIAVTANDNQKTVTECIEAGMMDVIFKPLTAKKITVFQSMLS
jgi:CheY-like chemotaxis protein